MEVLDVGKVNKKQTIQDKNKKEKDSGTVNGVRERMRGDTEQRKCCIRVIKECR